MCCRASSMICTASWISESFAYFVPIMFASMNGLKWFLISCAIPVDTHAIAAGRSDRRELLRSHQPLPRPRPLRGDADRRRHDRQQIEILFRKDRPHPAALELDQSDHPVVHDHRDRQNRSRLIQEERLRVLEALVL